MTERGRRLASRWKWLIIGILAGGNLLLWLLPSDVAALVARERPVLLGRYSKERMATLLALIPLTAMALFLLTARRESLRRRTMALSLLLLATGFALLTCDIALRLLGPADVYRSHDDGFPTRRPDMDITTRFEDVPLTARSYPDPRPGHPPVACRIQTDANGYRNLGPPPAAVDMVLLGDSFVEGSSVSQDQMWPTLLGQQRTASVYQLGLSGTGPSYQLHALERHGLALRPKMVVSMIYEGNDFRGSGAIDPPSRRARLGRRLGDLVKSSPLRRAAERVMLRLLGPLNARGAFPGQEALAWLPLTIPAQGPRQGRYTFPPKRLIDLSASAEEFAASNGWKTVTLVLARLQAHCEAAGATLVVVLAPSAPHVVLPLAADRLPADAIRQFVALRGKRLPDSLRPLPPAAPLLRTLLERLDVPERRLAAHCKTLGLPFISLVAPLRAAAAEGTPVYYTYDQHWTPAGHVVVARHLAERLPALRPTPPK